MRTGLKKQRFYFVRLASGKERLCRTQYSTWTCTEVSKWTVHQKRKSVNVHSSKSQEQGYRGQVVSNSFL